MRWRLGTGLALVCAVLSIASACAAQPLLSILSIYAEDDYLCLDFYLKNAVEKDLLESVRNGVPALLTYQIKILEDRANRYDKQVETLTFSYRITFDNWDTLYCVDTVARERQDTKKADAIADLVHMLCSQKKVKTCLLSGLSDRANYYITISAAVQSLSAQRVREIESWLAGAAEGSRPSGGGGLLGFVVDLFASNAKQAETRSNVFSLQALTR